MLRDALVALAVAQETPTLGRLLAALERLGRAMTAATAAVLAEMISTRGAAAATLQPVETRWMQMDQTGTALPEAEATARSSPSALCLPTSLAVVAGPAVLVPGLQTPAAMVESVAAVAARLRLQARAVLDTAQAATPLTDLRLEREVPAALTPAAAAVVACTISGPAAAAAAAL
jgi:hypothetical protein